MKWLAVCLLGSLWAAALADTEQQPELARCKRIMCDTKCPFGNKVDHNGCDLCDCKPNPCDNLKCPFKQACNPVPEPHCGECPMIKCKEGCPFGRVEENGCQKCECKENPCQDFKCKEGERCQPIKDCEAGQVCDMTPKCLPDDYHMEPEIACAMPMCASACQFGYKTDKNGCMTCDCRAEPCDTHRCPEGSECEAKEICDKNGACDVGPFCKVTPLCKRTKAEHNLQCDPEGSFMPTQCRRPAGALHKECWCVNDQGRETEGSRMKIPDEKNESSEEAEGPECVYNRTVTIHVKFILKHDIDQVEVHLGKIKEVVHRHITEWLMIDREYVLNLKVEPHTHKAHLLVVEFEVVRRGRIDLAATSVHLWDHMHHDHCHILYDHHSMDADKDSLDVHHTYGPDIPETPVEVGPQNRWRRCHKIVFILGIVGAVVLLVAVIFMIVVVNRKRLQRKRMRELAGKGDIFKQNIAFSNELYDQTNMLDGDIKKIKLEFTTEPVVEAKLSTNA